jgi:hypothetical protein
MKSIPVYLLLFAGLMMGSLSSYAQTVQRNLLDRWTQEEIIKLLVPQDQFKPFPQTPEGWKEILPDTVIDKLIKRGEIALHKDFKNIPATTMLDFTRNGNRTNYEKLSFEKRYQLWDLVMAESVEGKGRFLDQIVNGIWSISEESFWGISAHVYVQKAGSGLPDVEDPTVDLFAAETGSVMAWTDYLVGTQLEKVSKLIRPRIKYEINRRILIPMTTAKYGWMGGGNPNARLNNWAPWVASNYITAALLIEKDDAKRAQALSIAIQLVNQYMNGLGVDGGCDEGHSYWSAAGGCVFDALNLLYDATDGKINIYKDPFIQKMGSYIYKTHIAGDYFINVADAHPVLEPDGLMIYRFGENMGDKSMMAFGSWAYHRNTNGGAGSDGSFRSRFLYDMAAIKTCAAYPAKENNVADFWLSDVQLMASRTNNGLFISSHGGTNGESHNHNDIGDFIVYADGYPVIIDVGSGSYTARTFSADRYKLWFNTSPYHNLPTINEKEQGAGNHFAASDVIYKKSKTYSLFSMNIAKAYPKEAGVRKWDRSIKVNKGGNISINDNYEMSVPLADLKQSFMSVCDVDISQGGRLIFNLPNGTKVYLDYNPVLWSVSKEKMQLNTPEDQGLKGSWKGKDIWRILLTYKSLDSNKSITYLIHK